MIEPNDDRVSFVRASTRLGAPPLVPEVRLHLADDAYGLWERTEQEVGRSGLPPPFWAFAWAGGQALARYVLDHQNAVRGRRVLDFASGCGLVAVAAGKAGAATVRASDVDAFAGAAIALNAEANGVVVDTVLADVLDTDGGEAEVVLAGDVFYDRAMTVRVLAFFDRVRARGATVLVGDPGRAHLPQSRFQRVTAYDVPVPDDLEGMKIRKTTVWRLPDRSDATRVADRSVG